MHLSTAMHRYDNVLCRKKDKKKNGMHNTVIEYAYPSRNQRKFAYTSIFWFGSISNGLFHTSESIFSDYDVCGSNHSIKSNTFLNYRIKDVSQGEMMLSK